MDLTSFLANLVENKGSDLFLSAYSPPLMKVEGKMHPLTDEPLDPEINRQLIYSILTDREIATFEGEWELNKSLHLAIIGRFRVNVFLQRGEPAMVARHIKDKIPSIDSLGLPPQLKELIMEERGLILVAGGTGTGKSTTLAAMIDYRNSERTGHILTIEDPIEFIYQNKKSLVNQREVGLDTKSFDVALINAMREAPDVILIGEIRDAKTMKQAIAYAETGHLCLATLHANNANQTIDRIINFFPDEAHKQVLQDLSLNLKSVISQRLCIGVDDRRVAAVEVMVSTPYITELIYKGHVDEIKEAMERSKGRVSQTFDQALYELASEGRITEDEALRNADSRNNLALRFRLEQSKNNKGFPIKSEFSINKQAPFDHYETFRLTPVKVNGKQENTEQLISNGIANALQHKGLSIDEKTPDIDIQYMLGLKSMEGLALTPIADEGDAYKHYVPPTEEHAMLVINVIDTRTGKAVYRLTASRRTSEQTESQESINRLLVGLLDSLPVSR